MKAIIENGKINDGIQSCFISEYGVGIVFHNIDLADKFALSLNMYGIPCVKNGNSVRENRYNIFVDYYNQTLYKWTKTKFMVLWTN